jgi:glycosyltransferase involved in cell wall biosynthesis
MNIKKYIPSFLKRPLIIVYITARCILRGTGSKNIVLNMAGVLPPIGSAKIVHGGKVKLLYLREKFGESWKNFNVSYFASSGLPFASEWWIRIYKLFGIKVVWNQNGVAYPALYPKNIVENINALMRPIHLADYVVYQTEFTKRCADKYLGAFNGPSSIMINPVDTERFVPRSTPLPEEPLIIMMLGNHLESELRLTLALQAIQKLRDNGANIILNIIGQSDREFSETWVHKQGAYLQKDAPILFQSAHIFLHLKYLDPCPTTVEEALSCGLPVIGIKNGGMPELVDEQSGVLIPVVEDFEKLHYPSVDEVVEAIEKVRLKYSEYRKNAREGAVKKFDSRNWLDKHEHIFKNLCR